MVAVAVRVVELIHYLCKCIKELYVWCHDLLVSHQSSVKVLEDVRHQLSYYFQRSTALYYQA